MKRKKRNIILISILISISFLIYYKLKDNKITYLALGDEFVLGKTPFNKYSYSYCDYFARYLNNSKKLKNYDKSFSKNNYRVIDLINDIKNNNKNNKNEYLNQKILKADIITISIGNNDLMYKINNKKINKKTFDYIDNVFLDISYSIRLIRNITEKPIIFIGYHYNNINEKIRDYIYASYKTLENYKNVYYVNINDIDNRYFINNYPTLEGYNNIYNKILYLLNEKKIDL
jgi:lysophospholipase L1-like esterase